MPEKKLPESTNDEIHLIQAVLAERFDEPAPVCQPGNRRYPLNYITSVFKAREKYEAREKERLVKN